MYGIVSRYSLLADQRRFIHARMHSGHICLFSRDNIIRFYCLYWKSSWRRPCFSHCGCEFCFILVTLTKLIFVKVERAFKLWSTGEYTLPENKSLRKFSASLWQSITNEVMNSVDKVSDKRWVKIFEAAERYIGAHKPVSSMDVACAQQGLLSGRATCYEPDSD